MKNDKDDSADGQQPWSRNFAEDALMRAAKELEAFWIVGNHSLIASQRKLAEAALAIGWMVINEVGSLVGPDAVAGNRDHIITGLTDILRNSNPDGTHLGHDIVDAVAEAVGEYASREDSTYC